MCMAPTDPVLHWAAPVGAGALLPQGGLGKGARDPPSTPDTSSENAAGSTSSVSCAGLATEEHVGASTHATGLGAEERRQDRDQLPKRLLNVRLSH